MKQSDITISEVKLVYRTNVKASERFQVKTSSNAFEIFWEAWDQDSMYRRCKQRGVFFETCWNCTSVID